MDFLFVSSLIYGDTAGQMCVQWPVGGGGGLGIQGPIARAIEGNRVGPEIGLCNRALIVWGPQVTAGTAYIHG